MHGSLEPEPANDAPARQLEGRSASSAIQKAGEPAPTRVIPKHMLVAARLKYVGARVSLLQSQVGS